MARYCRALSFIELSTAFVFLCCTPATKAISDGMPETKILDVEHQRGSEGGAPPETVTDDDNGTWTCEACTFVNHKAHAAVCEMCQTPRAVSSEGVKRPGIIRRTSSRLGFLSSSSSSQPQPPPLSAPQPPPSRAASEIDEDEKHKVVDERPSLEERTSSLGRFGRKASFSSDEGTIHVTADSFSYTGNQAEAGEQTKPPPKTPEQKAGPRPTIFRPPAPPGSPPARPPPPPPKLPPPKLPPSQADVSGEVVSVVADPEELHANFADLGDIAEDSLDTLSKSLEMTLPRPLTKVGFDSDEERKLADTPTAAVETVERGSISVEAEFVELELAAHNIISTLEFEPAKPQRNEVEMYYTLKVDAPKDSGGGGGMFVWFDAGDQDGSKKTIARAKRGACGVGCCCKVFCTCFIRPGATFDVRSTSRVGVKQGFCGDEGKGFWDGSFVEFVHFDTSSKDIGATQLSSEERYGQGLETLPRYKYDGDRTKFKGIADTRIRFASLPTEREPLYIPAEGCAVRYFAPRGANRASDYLPSRFKIHAVHAPTRPIMFRTSFQRRRRHWIIYATMFVSKCAISFGPEERWQVYGVFLFLMASCVLGFDYAIHTYITMARERENRHILWDPRVWCSCVIEAFGCFCFCFRSSRRRHKEPTHMMAVSIEAEEEPRTYAVRAAAL